MLQRKWKTRWESWSTFLFPAITKSFRQAIWESSAAEVFQLESSRFKLEKRDLHFRQAPSYMWLSRSTMITLKVIQDYHYKLWLSGNLPQSTAGWSCSGSSLQTRGRGSRSTCDCYQCDLHLISDPTYQVRLYLALFVAELPNFCQLESVLVRYKFKQLSWICI